MMKMAELLHHQVCIRPMDMAGDMDAVIDIWLKASVAAHDFIASDYWKNQVHAMREQYLPHTQNYVYVKDGVLLGFYSLVKNTIDGADKPIKSVFLHALFVHPDVQGSGIGAQLIAHIKSELTAHLSQIHLRVYCKNTKAIRFYQRHGFEIGEKQMDKNTGEEDFCMIRSKKS